MPAGGLLCDRLGARHVLLPVDVLRAVLIGGLAVQVTLRPPSLVTLALFSALAGACQGTFVPSSYALMPATAPGHRLSEPTPHSPNHVRAWLLILVVPGSYMSQVHGRGVRGPGGGQHLADAIDT